MRASSPKFAIGIDLGTSNSVLAYAPCLGEGGSTCLAIPQRDALTTIVEAPALPSFLYLPEPAAAQMAGGDPGAGGWVVGRLAQRKGAETPDRVVTSAKSWLAHDAADRSAPFLPWRSEALGEGEKISPVAASALILAHLSKAWDARFASSGAPFAAQDVTVTVPASFDAAAQKLTLDAARQAGFPAWTRLLEEPQAAFYAWLERHAGRVAAQGLEGVAHILVIDIGGGTSDFSLFEARGEKGTRPAILRIAVSDHILLGGDNIDLAIAHLLEPRLTKDGRGLSPTQWSQLVARCRALKEEALGRDGAPEDVFAVSIPGRGSSLFAGAVSAQASRAEIEALVLDGFFPDCRLTDRPRRALGAVKEFGLPYAFDGAITRHLADFLGGRPKIDAVLFNGGSLKSVRLRERLAAQIGRWQDGATPQLLDSADLDLAVALGAAYAGRLAVLKREAIEAGASRAVFLEAQRAGAARSLICILPQGAAPGTTFELSDFGLRLRVNTPVRFQIFTSTRRADAKAGDVVEFAEGAFHPLPPLETAAMLDAEPDGEDGAIAAALEAGVNDLGLLQLSLRSLAPGVAQSWPLEFNLRPQENARASASIPATAPAEPEAAPAAREEAKQRLRATFAPVRGRGEKPNAARLLQSLEQILGRPRGAWSGALLRDLWEGLEAAEAGRALSAEHEEVWLSLAGFLLRPGFGVAMDERRIDALWRLVAEAGPRFPGKRTRLQEHILWRRVAGGLSRERQERLLAAERDKLDGGKAAPELIRMAGAFERLGEPAKAALIERFIATAADLAAQKKHCAPYLAALGSLLARTPFYAGPESVAAPVFVERSFEALRGLDWSDPEFAEAQALFLRAARAVDDRRLDAPRALRHEIAHRLEKYGVAPLRTSRLREFTPVEQAERLSLYGEALPPGLILSD